MRRTGKTTRMVDLMVQHLFKNGRVVIPLLDLSSEYWEKKFGNDAFFDLDCADHNIAQFHSAKTLHRRLMLEHRDSFVVKKHLGHVEFTLK